ncbi:transmembrane protein, putative (macronuclear) [Tetrahymena thermophila SB210]|uniref:Transmembrane protein, putative n=1 Tax=Tetrahymena thermophila (strain SB210) TaxID=312017 RepID=W7XK11_TETTS|nr:transmembrane protein, putative [Tetrahymena thermophila SB210]EWS76121.1 transmembrane protein, putative [Tetrahymena thermophila SB210]|eukprot:XP_012651361.1 transmembrane protein, putative [Tetrahymena thermophila SB210]
MRVKEQQIKQNNYFYSQFNILLDILKININLFIGKELNCNDNLINFIDIKDIDFVQIVNNTKYFIIQLIELTLVICQQFKGKIQNITRIQGNQYLCCGVRQAQKQSVVWIINNKISLHRKQINHQFQRQILQQIIIIYLNRRTRFLKRLRILIHILCNQIVIILCDFLFIEQKLLVRAQLKIQLIHQQFYISHCFSKTNRYICPNILVLKQISIIVIINTSNCYLIINLREYERKHFNFAKLHYYFLIAIRIIAAMDFSKLQQSYFIIEESFNCYCNCYLFNAFTKYFFLLLLSYCEKYPSLVTFLVVFFKQINNQQIFLTMIILIYQFMYQIQTKKFLINRAKQISKISKQQTSKNYSIQISLFQDILCQNSKLMKLFFSTLNQKFNFKYSNKLQVSIQQINLYLFLIIK